MSRTALQAYGTQQVMTSTPVKLIALLYDKAIISLKEAIQAIADGEIEKRWQANNKAVEIITHLANTLDHDKGGEVAGNLDQLYDFMLARLLNVDLKNDPQPAREVIDLLMPLREAWHQLAEEAPQGGAQPGYQGDASKAPPSQPAASQETIEAEVAPLKPVNLSA